MRIQKRTAPLAIPVAGGKVSIPLDALLIAGHRIDTLAIVAEMNSDVPGAGVTVAQQRNVIKAVDCGRRIEAASLGLFALDWQLNGGDAQPPTPLIAGAGQSTEHSFAVAFRDPRFIEPTDFSPATKFYAGATLDVTFAKLADIVPAWVLNSGSVYVVADLSELGEGTIPASIVTSFVEVMGKETKLPAGRLVDAVLVKTSGATITAAELGDMRFTADAKTHLFEDATASQLARQFNRYVARGADFSIEGEALPVAGPYPFVSLVAPMRPQKATQLPRAVDSYLFRYSGTLAAGSARIYYRMVEELDEAASVKAARKLGYDLTGATIAPKTSSKNGVPETAIASAFSRVAGVFARKVYRNK